MRLLLVQGPCAQCLERPNFKRLEFGEGKDLLIEKALTEKKPSGSSNPSSQSRVQVSFMSRVGEMGGARGDWPVADIWAQAEIQGRLY